MIKVLMGENDVVELLVKRVSYWTDDSDVVELFRRMYDSYVDSGVFESVDFDVMQIVDNDYINYCDVISEGGDGYNEIKALYENGEYDISCGHIQGYNYIEAEYNGLFLVRC